MTSRGNSVDDSTKVNKHQVFDINDPRNPNCPCHKYQKQADEEYKKLLLQGIANNEQNKIIQVQQMNAHPGHNSTQRPTNQESRSFSAAVNKVHKKHRGSYAKHKHHNRLSGHPRLRRILDVKHWDFWKRVTDPTRCYRWD
jgi:hypothetical protein